MPENGQSPRDIAKLITGAAALAALLFVVIVLPAEFDTDPTGIGNLLGIKGISTGLPSPVTSAGELPLASQGQQFELAPFESVEIKYRLTTDAGLTYRWIADGEIVYELHAEPDGAPKGEAESFDKSRNSSAAGTYIATFDGIHGWFFENRSAETVTVTIAVAGFFSEGIIYRGGYPDPFTVKPLTSN